MVRPRATALAIATALTLSGCGSDGLPRERISGKVTLDGRPVDSGSITFLPTASDAPGTGAEAPIRAGAFDVPAAQGPIPGTYLVLVSSPVPDASRAAPKRKARGVAEDTSGTGTPEAAEVPLRESIPEEYNTKSTLKAEVKSGGPNTFEFPLTTK
ncbi:MAG: hypothetical protein U0800_01265 [Isosphaeraceae bacterium]